jgi:VIT1/CCC1 family predicted Fe2+/Mn2+ transporter
MERELGAPVERAMPRSHEEKHRDFVLQVVQPGLAGMMDGSVSTLAPIFAAAFALSNPHTVFLIGLAAALGAGVSMAFAEALSDDGSITGRGSPWLRGGVEGLMTFIGGFGHTLPFLLPHMGMALTLAYVVVAIELVIISWIRFHYFRLNFVRSSLQVLGGGLIVVIIGVILGQS